MARHLSYSWLSAIVVGIASSFSSSVGARQPDLQVAAENLAGTVWLKSEDGHLLISEHGRSFEPLNLGDTPEADHLRRLFGRLSPDGSAVQVPIDRRMVADGGVSAYKPKPAKKRSGPKSHSG